MLDWCLLSRSSFCSCRSISQWFWEALWNQWLLLRLDWSHLLDPSSLYQICGNFTRVFVVCEDWLGRYHWHQASKVHDLWMFTIQVPWSYTWNDFPQSSCKLQPYYQSSVCQRTSASQDEQLIQWIQPELYQICSPFHLWHLICDCRTKLKLLCYSTWLCHLLVA